MDSSSSSSPMSGKIEKALQDKIKDIQELTVIDTTQKTCGSSFSINIVSKTFKGKPLVSCHRLVQSALGSLMDEIHAVTITAKAPPE